MSNAIENIVDRAWDLTGPALGLRKSLTTKAAAWIAAWKADHAYRREVGRLEVMDERLLRDIGLTRTEIGRAVRFGRSGD